MTIPSVRLGGQGPVLGAVGVGTSKGHEDGQPTKHGGHLQRMSQWDAPPTYTQGWVFGKLGSLQGMGEFFPPYVESRTRCWEWVRLFTGCGLLGPRGWGLMQESSSSENEMGNMRAQD